MVRLLIPIILLLTVSGLYSLSGYGISPLGSIDNISPRLSTINPEFDVSLYHNQLVTIACEIIDQNVLNGNISYWFSCDNSPGYTQLGSSNLVHEPFNWIVPEIDTNNARIKIIIVDYFGNSRTWISEPFSISAAPPCMPVFESITINPSQGVELTWYPVTSNVLGQQLAPEYYVLYSSQSPDIASSWDVVTVTKALYYHHQWAAMSNQTIFYKLTACYDFVANDIEDSNHD